MLSWWIWMSFVRSIKQFCDVSTKALIPVLRTYEHWWVLVTAGVRSYMFEDIARNLKAFCTTFWTYASTHVWKCCEGTLLQIWKSFENVIIDMFASVLRNHWHDGSFNKALTQVLGAYEHWWDLVCVDKRSHEFEHITRNLRTRWAIFRFIL